MGCLFFINPTKKETPDIEISYQPSAHSSMCVCRNTAALR